MTDRWWESSTGVSATLANVTRPIEEWASGLPNEAYVSDEFAEWEQDVLLARTWACIGTGRRVPEVGDAIPLEFAGLPLIMLRGRDGEVRVFHNVCSHRGMVLMDKPTRTRGTIRCPYHSWTYELDGSLRSTPMIGGTDKKHVPGLRVGEAWPEAGAGRHVVGRRVRQPERRCTALRELHRARGEALEGFRRRRPAL